MWTRKELKQNAKAALKRNYWKAVLVSLILIMLGGSYSPAFATSTGGRTADEHAADTIEQNYELVSGTENMYVLTEDAAGAVSSDLKQLNQTNPVVLIAAVVTFLIIVLIIIAIVMVFCILVANPLIVGSRRFMIKSIEGNGKVAEIGYAFDHSYFNCVKIMFFRELHIFLWSLLFIIPGIYKKYQYYLVEYIAAENPEMPWREALELSKRRMEGHKWNTFVLDLSFILWHMLSLVTCGLSEILYVQPYQNLTRASLYLTLISDKGGRNGI